MIVVLDASGAAEINAKTNNGIEFYNMLMRADKVLTPDLYVAETVNMIWKQYRKANASLDECTEIAEDCINYIDEYISSADLWDVALTMALEQDHPVYDMLYAALAKEREATLLTMDKGLRRICENLSINVKEVY